MTPKSKPFEKLRDKINRDMDHRFSLYSPEWEYAKEITQFLNMLEEEEVA